MELVAFIGTDKENWGQITGLINRSDAEKIILVKNKKADDFPGDERCDVIEIDSSLPISIIREDLTQTLRKKLTGDFEVALSIASGTGKEHMALISALLNIPVGIKIAVFTQKGIEYLS